MDRIIVKNVSKNFKIGFRKNESALARFLSFFSGVIPSRKIKVLDNVSFSVQAGEILGIMGPNGSGKSTLLRVIAGIYKPDSGKIICNGKIISLINLGIGLQPRLTMRENIYLCCSLFGLGRREINLSFKDIIEFSGLKDFIDTKLYQFSSGMLQRLAFSIAIYCKPDILLLDEVFEVGDEEFKIKSSYKIKELAKNGASVILVTHYNESIEWHCNAYMNLEKGRILSRYSVDSKNFQKQKDIYTTIKELSEKKNANFNFVQIGSNDGVMDDPFYYIVRLSNWKCIFVEPVTSVYNKLKLNYDGKKDAVFINKAISDKQGYKQFYRFKSSDKLPKWADMLGSFNKRVILKHKKFLDKNAFLVSDNALCMTFSNLIDECNISKIDLLHIDTEGHDYKIIKSIPFYTLKPNFIYFEHRHLSKSNMKKCFELLKSQGYNLSHLTYDTFAYLKNLR